MAPPARTITVALDKSKAFDTINIHTLIGKLLQTNIPGTIIKFITNYIKGRKAYTTYRNRAYNVNLKLVFPKVASSHPRYLTFTLYTYHHPEHGLRRWHHHHIYTHKHECSKEIHSLQPYLYKVFTWTKHNNLTLKPDKTTCTLFTPDSVEYTSNLATHTNVLCFTIDPKLTYNTLIHTISVHAHKPLHIVEALTATGWDKQNG